MPNCEAAELHSPGITESNNCNGRGAKLQSCRIAELQNRRVAELQSCRVTELQSYRVAE